jgi:hypothetical protein
MQYMLLIYSDEKADVDATPEELEAWMGHYNQYTADLREAGAIVGGEALQPTAAATTVRVRDGKMLTTHGPFAETQEQLGGFYLIECDNLDGALQWAARCPGARVGSVEVRPVIDFSQAQ